MLKMPSQHREPHISISRGMTKQYSVLSSGDILLDLLTLAYHLIVLLSYCLMPYSIIEPSSIIHHLSSIIYHLSFIIISMPMSMSTPDSLDEFHSIFSSWPGDSLSHRIDRIPAGSSWDIRELGTFQILRSPPAKETPPTWLQSHFVEASARVRESVPMQSVLRLFRQDWRNKTHEDLTQAAGPLASFVTLLSQVLETAIVSDPRRELRDQEIHTHNLPSTGLSSSPSIPSSPPEYPNKRFHKDRSSSSYWPSDESDQSSYDQRTKSEATTNACIYELLRCVTEISRNKNDSPFRLEWTITQDTVIVHAGSHEYCTTNDGNFVHKAHRMGCWQRASNYSYCSIEVSLLLISLRL